MMSRLALLSDSDSRSDATPIGSISHSTQRKEERYQTAEEENNGQWWWYDQDQYQIYLTDLVPSLKV